MSGSPDRSIGSRIFPRLRFGQKRGSDMEIQLKPPLIEATEPYNGYQRAINRILKDNGPRPLTIIDQYGEIKP